MKKKIKWYNYRAYSDRNIDLKKNAEAGERWKERHPEVIEKINKITVPKSHLNYFFKKDNYKYLGYEDILECLDIINNREEEPDILFDVISTKKNYEHINGDKFKRKRSDFNVGKKFLMKNANLEELKDFKRKLLELKHFFDKYGYDKIDGYVIELNEKKYPNFILNKI